VKLFAPPLYVIITNSLDKNLGIETLEKAIETIKVTIEKSNGTLTVKMRVSKFFSFVIAIAHVYCDNNIFLKNFSQKQ